jgi:hypothetical protein
MDRSFSTLKEKNGGQHQQSKLAAANLAGKSFLTVPVPTGAPSTARSLHDSDSHVS